MYYAVTPVACEIYIVYQYLCWYTSGALTATSPQIQCGPVDRLPITPPTPLVVQGGATSFGSYGIRSEAIKALPETLHVNSQRYEPEQKSERRVECTRTPRIMDAAVKFQIHPLVSVFTHAYMVELILRVPEGGH